MKVYAVNTLKVSGNLQIYNKRVIRKLYLVDSCQEKFLND